MAKKLYIVEKKRTLLVLAEDMADAEWIADMGDNETEETSMYPSNGVLPSGWHKDCLVYHNEDGEDDITVEQAQKIADQGN